jgi:predicted amidophosphoribosyltransferase
MTEPQRTCPTCGNELSEAMELCPVCLLRKGLSDGVESGESSAPKKRSSRQYRETQCNDLSTMSW